MAFRQPDDDGDTADSGKRNIGHLHPTQNTRNPNRQPDTQLPSSIPDSVGQTLQRRRTAHHRQTLAGNRRQPRTRRATSKHHRRRNDDSRRNSVGGTSTQSIRRRPSRRRHIPARSGHNLRSRQSDEKLPASVGEADSRQRHNLIRMPETRRPRTPRPPKRHTTTLNRKTTS